MAPEVTLECMSCHHQKTRPVHISTTGFALVSWPHISCGCGGKLEIVKKSQDIKGSGIRYGTKTAVPISGHKSECEKAIEKATPYWVHEGDITLQEICKNERLLILSDGSEYKVTKVD